jgi:hypothetical protein
MSLRLPLAAPRRAAPLWTGAACLLIVVAALAYYAWHWGSIEHFMQTVDHCGILFCDFTNHYYPMGAQVWSDPTPVRGYFYSPFFAVLLSGPASLPLPAAQWLWAALQVLLALALYALPTADLFRTTRSGLLLYTLLLATSLPLLHNFKWGQVSVLLTVGTLAALLLYGQERRGGAAALLAFVAAIKFYPAIFALPALLRRDGRFVLLFGLLLALLLALLPALLLGVGPTLAFYAQLRSILQQFQQDIPPVDVNSQYVAHVIPRLLAGAVDTSSMLYMALKVGGYAVALLHVALLALLVARRVPQQVYWTCALLFPALPFVIETSWPHYFVYLPLVQAFLAVCVLHDTWPHPAKAALLLGLLLPSAVLASAPFFNLVGDWEVYGRQGYLFIANALLLPLLYTQAARALRRAPEPTGGAL